MNSPTMKPLLATSIKTLATVLVWIATVLLARFHLAPNETTWTATLQRIPTPTLLGSLLVVPIAWLAVEFCVTCFLELRAQLLENAAPQAAAKVRRLPGAAAEVLRRWWDVGLGIGTRWRFDGRYRRRVAEECQQLHKQTGLLHATAGFSLDEAYTELNIAASQYSEANQSLFAAQVRGRESVYNFLRRQESGTALALLGRPGGGKTTLLRHLALVFARNQQGRYRLRRKIPILIELRRVTEMFADIEGGRWERPSLSTVINHYWRQQAGLKTLAAEAPENWLTRKLASGRAIVMIDGLDEVPHQLDIARPDVLTPRQRASEWLAHEMQQDGQRRCLFIVTSRPGGFSEAPITERTFVLEVQPLTPPQRERFIKAFHLGCYLHAHPTARKDKASVEATRATGGLLIELRSKPHLAELWVNPLLLHMMCLLHYLRGRLPADRADLYKETCEILLNRDLRAPGLRERLRPEDKLAALRPLADYFMRSASPEPKTTAELMAVIQPVFQTLDFPAGEFFKYAAADSGLMQEVEPGRWDFAHKTFYEYLAAEHWKRFPPTLTELREWVALDWWRVALLFYSGNSDDSPVIAAALARRTPEAWSLASTCLSAGHRLNASERRRAQSQLLTALSLPTDEQMFRPAARALMDSLMRETQSLSSDDGLVKRASVVSNAEYQLFIQSVGSGRGHDMLPWFWRGGYFSGDPKTPVVGVTPSQAVTFAGWASASGEHEWVVGAVDLLERDSLPDGCWLFDKRRNAYRVCDQAGRIRNYVMSWGAHKRMEEGDVNAVMNQLALDPSELFPGLVARDRTPKSSVMSARSREARVSGSHTERVWTGSAGFDALWAAYLHQVRSAKKEVQIGDRRVMLLELGRVSQHITLSSATALGTALQSRLQLRSCRLAVDILRRSSGYWMEQSAGAVECGCLLLTIAESHGFVDLAERLKAFFHGETLQISDDEAPGRVPEAAVGRMIAGSLSVLNTVHDWEAHRIAWKDYARTLLSICRLAPNVSLERVALVFDSLFDRDEGVQQPWETILLIRRI